LRRSARSSPGARARVEGGGGGCVGRAARARAPACAGPPLQIERLKPPAGGREFVLTQADGTLVFAQRGDKDAEDLAAHVTQVFRIASATLQRAGLGALRRGIVQAATETSFFRSNDRLILSLSFPHDVKIGLGLLETDKLWTNSLRELGVRGCAQNPPPPPGPRAPASPGASSPRCSGSIAYGAASWSPQTVS